MLITADIKYLLDFRLLATYVNLLYQLHDLGVDKHASTATATTY